MDESEKRVLRYKRNLVASKVIWTDELERALKQHHLASDGVILQLESESSSFSRMSRYIELLLKGDAWLSLMAINRRSSTPLGSASTAFSLFCDVIENEGDQPFVAEELRTELRNERGELAIEDCIQKEASQMIHRLFGGNKRMSERDKRRFENLLSIRTQCTKEVWRRNLELTESKLINAQSMAIANVADTIMAARNVQDAVGEQRKALDGRHGIGSKTMSFSADAVTGLKTARDASTLPAVYSKKGLVGHGSSAYEDVAVRVTKWRNSGDNEDTLKSGRGFGDQKQGSFDGINEMLSEAADQIRRMTDAWSSERDKLRAERSRTLGVLGIHESTSASLSSATRRLDVEVMTALQRLNTELSNAKERVLNAEDRVSALEDRLRSSRGNMDEEIRSKDRTIALLTANLERAEKEADARNYDARDLKHQLQLVKSELSHYSVKSKYLEKSRHLGYISDATDSVDRNGSHLNNQWPNGVTRSAGSSSSTTSSKQKTHHINHGIHWKPAWRGGSN